MCHYFYYSYIKKKNNLSTQIIFSSSTLSTANNWEFTIHLDFITCPLVSSHSIIENYTNSSWCE